MNAFAFSLLCAFFLLMAAAVHAADFEITSGSELRYGGANTPKQENFTSTIKLKNKFPDARLENMQFEFSPKNNFRQNGVEIPSLPTSLDNETEISVAVAVRPEDFDVVEDTLKKRGSLDIGTLKFKATAVNNTPGGATPGSVETNSITLKLELRNDLDLVSVEIKSKQGSFSSVSADSTVTLAVDEDYDLRFKIKNTFDSSSGIELENINIKIVSDDLDIEKTTTISEILAGATGEKTTTISADDTGTGEVKILVSGDDKFGGKHGELFTFNFKVEESDEEEQKESPTKDDADGDGVPDSRDECLNTVSVCDVDTTGCPIDSDADGTCDALDATPKPAPRQTNNNLPLASNDDEDAEDKATSRATKPETPAQGTSGFIPFLIGFAIGILVTAGFSVLIKS